MDSFENLRYTSFSVRDFSYEMHGLKLSSFINGGKMNIPDKSSSHVK